MRNVRSARPGFVESLETRAVPVASALASTVTAVVATPTGLPGITVSLPAQVPTTSPAVKAAFAAFDQSFVRAVDTYLLAPGPSSSRAAFDAALVKSLDALAQDLVNALGASASPTTAGQVSAAIVGKGPTSLESQLLALSTTTLEQEATSAASNSSALAGIVSLSESIPFSTLISTAEAFATIPRNPIPQEELGDDGGSDLGAAGSTSPADESPAGQGVRSAFGDFLAAYYKAVQNTLLAPSPTGQVDPAANRAAFDEQVGRALQTLDLGLVGSLGRSSATSALGPRVRSAIEGNGPESLKGQLAALPTPQADTVRTFTLGSAKVIAQALAAIGAEVDRALTTPAGPGAP